MTQYIAPEFEKKTFTCPHCNAHSTMDWSWREVGGHYLERNLISARCHGCSADSIWFQEVENSGWYMIHPQIKTSPMPSPDLPETCVSSYMEARDIADRSPSGAAALLRLCIDHLCLELGATQNKLNGKIGYLVSEGLPITIQQALDSVRVIGNDAVHPGKLDLDDTSEVVKVLFTLINIIVNDRITQPNLIQGIYGLIPENQKNGINQRDAKAND